MLEWPKFYRVRQYFPRPRVNDLVSRLDEELEKLEMDKKIKPGDSIAITGGSRGINGIPVILARTAEKVRQCGGDPVIVSAMGSHGGGPPEGQREILASLGITPETVGCPVICSSEVLKIGVTPTHGVDVFCAKEAVEAGGVIVINRIKGHTAFRASRESGLLKMMGIGLGRVPGADMIHSLGTAQMGQVILEMAGVVMEKAPVLGGIAIVENGYEETEGLYGLRPGEIAAREAELLQKANALMPRLPVADLDLLIIDEMGKDYSGTGMDTNIIGRWRIAGVPEPESPKIQRIVVLGLSQASHGNANGIGLADFTTKRLVERIDYRATYLNALTTGFLQRVMIPIIMENDREAIQKALDTLKMADISQARVMRIKNTLHLEEVMVSESLKNEVVSLSNVEVVAGPSSLSFDNRGNLQGFKE